MTVTDDGVGLGVEPDHLQRRSGLANLADRADERSGSLTVAAVGSGDGTTVTWWVPAG